MGERIDHAEQSRRLLHSMTVAEIGTIQASLMAAQVNATLALVEQQRIANLIALVHLEAANDATPSDAIGAIWSREEIGPMFKLHTRPDIAAALGIGRPE